MTVAHAIRSCLILSLAVVGMTACSSDNDDLDQYINEVKARPGGRIDPLPEITPYEIFTYAADTENFRSPFIPDTPQIAAGGGNGLRPVEDRSPEFLEGHSLDTLRMVGTLDISDTLYGLVQTSDGLEIAGRQDTDHLKKDELPVLWGRAGDVLHRSPMVKMFKQMKSSGADYADIFEWSAKITGLLNCHWMTLVENKKGMLVSLSAEDTNEPAATVYDFSVADGTVNTFTVRVAK